MDEFAGRLAQRNIANFIEWNGSLYATEIEELDNALRADHDSLLLEDMPSTFHLKQIYGSRITVILLFSDDEHELLRLEFATLARIDRLTGQRDSIQQWIYRLELKFKAAKNQIQNQQARDEYIRRKMMRAIPDLAFMAGKIRLGMDIRVLANRTGAFDETIVDFQSILKKVRERQRKSVFVLMPFREEFNLIYTYVIKSAVETEGMTCKRGDEIFEKRVVVDDVNNHIKEADLILADISGGNPNVFWELGVSMTLNKSVVLIAQTQEDSTIPFNVRHLRRINYTNTPEGWESLNGQLSSLLTDIRQGTSIGRI